MILRIAVCDDDTEMLQILSDWINRIFKEKEIMIELEAFSEGKELLDKHKEASFQVVFLDIAMPDMDGFQIAEALKQHNRKIYIIFVTSKDELVYKSFDYQPFHFIRKGEAKELESQLRHVAEKLITYSKYYDSIKLIRPHGLIEEVVVGEIVVVRSEKNYLEYEMSDNRTIRIRGSLIVAEEVLQKYDFVRISSRALVNLNYIVRIKEREGEVILKTGFVYSLSRNNKKSVVEAYMKYLRSRK